MACDPANPRCLLIIISVSESNKVGSRNYIEEYFKLGTATCKLCAIPDVMVVLPQVPIRFNIVSGILGVAVESKIGINNLKRKKQG